MQIKAILHIFPKKNLQFFKLKFSYYDKNLRTNFQKLNILFCQHFALISDSISILKNVKLKIFKYQKTQKQQNFFPACNHSNYNKFNVSIIINTLTR